MILSFLACLLAYAIAQIILASRDESENGKPSGNILVVDTETTGLPGSSEAGKDANPRLVEITWILISPSGEELSKRTHIIKPVDFYISPASTEIHGITNQEALRKGTSISKVLHHLSDAIESAAYLVGHNIEFDKAILLSEIAQNEINLSGLSDLKTICTMKSTEHFCKIESDSVYGKYKWPTLSELHESLFEESITIQHNSRSDAEVCLKCFKELYNRRIITMA